LVCRHRHIPIDQDNKLTRCREIGHEVWSKPNQARSACGPELAARSGGSKVTRYHLGGGHRLCRDGERLAVCGRSFRPLHPAVRAICERGLSATAGTGGRHPQHEQTPATAMIVLPWKAFGAASNANRCIGASSPRGPKPERPSLNGSKCFTTGNGSTAP
jgi:hypothetical protein